jgi:hypothetical protein
MVLISQQHNPQIKAVDWGRGLMAFGACVGGYANCKVHSELLTESLRYIMDALHRHTYLLLFLLQLLTLLVQTIYTRRPRILLHKLNCSSCSNKQQTSIFFRYTNKQSLSTTRILAS